MTEQIDGVGWYEFIHPRGSTTHIAHVHENGDVYLPEGSAVVTEEDFKLAAATSRFWRLVRVEPPLPAGVDLEALREPGIYKIPTSVPDIPIIGYVNKHTDPSTGITRARMFDLEGNLLQVWQKAPGEGSKWTRVAT